MSDDGYNGWSSYQTWNVSLWFGNDEGLYRALAREWSTEPVRDAAAAERIAKQLMGDKTPDDVSLDDSDIDWAELAESWDEDYIEDEDEDEDTEPFEDFDSESDAVAYAANWGSYISSGDPGACMYGFSPETGIVVQDEIHRKKCLYWLRKCIEECDPEGNDSHDANDPAKLKRLREMIAEAPVDD